MGSRNFIYSTSKYDVNIHCTASPGLGVGDTSMNKIGRNP
jgi:hypothetical protein